MTKYWVSIYFIIISIPIRSFGRLGSFRGLLETSKWSRCTPGFLHQQQRSSQFIAIFNTIFISIFCELSWAGYQSRTAISYLPSKGCIFFENSSSSSSIAKLQQTNNEVSPASDTPVQNKFHFQHFLFTPQEFCDEGHKKEIIKMDLLSILDKLGFCCSLVIIFPIVSILALWSETLSNLLSQISLFLCKCINYDITARVSLYSFSSIHWFRWPLLRCSSQSCRMSHPRFPEI